MKLENKVTSLEIAQKLWDMGVRIKSEYSYAFYKNTKKWGIVNTNNHPTSREGYISAPLSCEILEVLPDVLKIDEDKAYLSVSKRNICDRLGNTNTVYLPYYLIYDDLMNKDFLYMQEDIGLANSCGLILIYLLENDLIKLEDVNR